MKYIYIILLITIGFQSLAYKNEFEWNGKISSADGKRLAYSHLQVTTEGKDYLYTADKDGLVNIRYPNFSENDSLTVTYLGFQSVRISCRKLLKMNTILLQEKIQELEEIVVHANKIKNVRLGNLIKQSFRSSQIAFLSQSGLYIPNNGIESKIKSVRIYMHSYGNKDWKLRPFRLRLYKGRYPFDQEISPKMIIAALSTKGKRWVTIDLSSYDMDFPKEGILVAVQALSSKYYLEHGYIKSRLINGNQLNSISIGTTTGSRTKLEIEGWTRNYYTKKWKKNEGVLRNFMIQLDVITYE